MFIIHQETYSIQVYLQPSSNRHRHIHLLNRTPNLSRSSRRPLPFISTIGFRPTRMFPNPIHPLREKCSMSLLYHRHSHHIFEQSTRTLQRSERPKAPTSPSHLQPRSHRKYHPPNHHEERLLEDVGAGAIYAIEAMPLPGTKTPDTAIPWTLDVDNRRCQSVLLWEAFPVMRHMGC